ncbi:MAG: hypothetical protein FWE80_03710 [Oscillospiraceae bacterium]|nr:hypothetical protein [Oscillospiraceae bacterium]
MNAKIPENTATDTAAAEEQEYAEAMKAVENNKGTYTHKFVEPFVWMGKTYTELRFDWGSLTMTDTYNIEEELRITGKKSVVSKKFDTYFHAAMAARACTEKIGTDAIDAMSMADGLEILERAQLFLINRGLKSATAGTGTGSNA